MKEIFRIVKEWFSRDHTRLALGIGIFSAGVAGYSLGVLRHLSVQEQPITMTIVPPQESAVTIPRVSGATNTLQAMPAIDTATPRGICVFVGSKNSTLYHLPKCAAAKRIKDANKVCFPSKDVAEAKGYKPGCLK
jgi:hypothetical protein